MQNLIPVPAENKKVYIAALGEDAIAAGFKIQEELRSRHVIADMDLQGRSLKGQMKQAGRMNAVYTIIIGSNELEKGKAVVKTMETGTQQELPFEEVADYIVTEETNSNQL